MADDWQAGDLALCVRTVEWIKSGASGPRAGQVFTVESVTRGVRGPSAGVLGLVLVGFPAASSTGAWSAEVFRKIRPHAPDAEDMRTIALLNGKPVREGA